MKIQQGAKLTKDVCKDQLLRQTQHALIGQRTGLDDFPSTDQTKQARGKPICALGPRNQKPGLAGQDYVKQRNEGLQGGVVVLTLKLSTDVLKCDIKKRIPIKPDRTAYNFIGQEWKKYWQKAKPSEHPCNKVCIYTVLMSVTKQVKEGLARNIKTGKVCNECSKECPGACIVNGFAVVADSKVDDQKCKAEAKAFDAKNTGSSASLRGRSKGLHGRRGRSSASLRGRSKGRQIRFGRRGGRRLLSAAQNVLQSKVGQLIPDKDGLRAEDTLVGEGNTATFGRRRRKKKKKKKEAAAKKASKEKASKKSKEKATKEECSVKIRQGTTKLTKDVCKDQENAAKKK